MNTLTLIAISLVSIITFSSLVGNMMQKSKQHFKLQFKVKEVERVRLLSEEFRLALDLGEMVTASSLPSCPTSTTELTVTPAMKLCWPSSLPAGCSVDAGGSYACLDSYTFIASHETPSSPLQMFFQINKAYAEIKDRTIEPRTGSWADMSASSGPPKYKGGTIYSETTPASHGGTARLLPPDAASVNAPHVNCSDTDTNCFQFQFCFSQTAISDCSDLQLRTQTIAIRKRI